MFIKDIILDSPIDVGSYLKHIPAVRYLEENGRLTFTKNVTFLVGENGTGKSTLIEAVAIAFGLNPEGGTRNFTFSTNNTHSELHAHITLSRTGYARDGFFLRAESMYNVTTSIEQMSDEGLGRPIIESYGGISLHGLSHGESFLSVVQNRFFGNGVYILDEPEAALSPGRMLVLMREIRRLERAGSQFIIATHSPILMSYPDSEVLLLSDDGIAPVDYRQTEHYILTKRLLIDPDSVFQTLFGTDSDEYS